MLIHTLCLMAIPFTSFHRGVDEKRAKRNRQRSYLLKCISRFRFNCFKTALARWWVTPIISAAC